MSKIRLGWIMEDSLKKPQERQGNSQKSMEKRQVKPQELGEVRYCYGKFKVELLRKTSQGYLCKALTPFTVSGLKVEMNMEFLVEPRFLWKTKRRLNSEVRSEMG